MEYEISPPCQNLNANIHIQFSDIQFNIFQSSSTFNSIQFSVNQWTMLTFGGEWELNHLTLSFNSNSGRKMLWFASIHS